MGAILWYCSFTEAIAKSGKGVPRELNEREMRRSSQRLETVFLHHLQVGYWNSPYPRDQEEVKFSAVVLMYRNTTGQIGGREWGWISREAAGSEKTLRSYFKAKIYGFAGNYTIF
jgi:hypothetical protein